MEENFRTLLPALNSIATADYDKHSGIWACTPGVGKVAVLQGFYNQLPVATVSSLSEHVDLVGHCNTSKHGTTKDLDPLLISG